MATLKNSQFEKLRNDTYPATESVVLDNCISLAVKCTGESAVKYEFDASGETGEIQPDGKPVLLVSNSDGVSDTIEFTFTNPATIEVTWSDGASSTGGGSVDDILAVITGNTETPELVEDTNSGGSGVTDVALSVALYFDGDGGTLEGVAVPDGFIAEYSGTFRNQVDELDYEVPIGGNGRVLIAYTKI